MNRELEFRAWDTIKKIMYSSNTLGQDQLTLSCDGRGIINCHSQKNLSEFYTHIIPLQYIGLKDKKGVKIFEGNIIKSTFYNKGNIIGVVVFDSIDLRYVFEHKDPEKETRSYLPLSNTYVSERHQQVIGNIFENPGLLEEK